MNNFSPASAIVTALMSPKVAMLFLACESQAMQIIHMLNRDPAPTSGAYYETLRQAGTKELIPWLGMVAPLPMSFYHLTSTLADPHLSTLNSTFAHSDPIVEVDGHYLIDFKLCSELAEQIDSIAEYSPPPVSSEIRQDVLEYVEYNLQSSLAVKTSCAAVVRSARRSGKERSTTLTKRETKKSPGELWQGRTNTRRREGQMVQRRGGVVRWPAEDMTPRRREEMVRQREEKVVRQREEMARRSEEDMARWHKDMARWHKDTARWRKDTARWRKDTTRWRKDNARRGEEDMELLPEEDMSTVPRRKGLLSRLFGSKAVKK